MLERPGNGKAKWNMQQKKTDDPLAGMEELIQAAVAEQRRLNPQFGKQEPRISDEEAERLDREWEDELGRHADVMDALGKLKPSEIIIRDRGE